MFLVTLSRKLDDFGFHIQNLVDHARLDRDNEQVNGALFFIQKTSNDIHYLMNLELRNNTNKIKEDVKRLMKTLNG
jgi:hypothetical protein